MQRFLADDVFHPPVSLAVDSKREFQTLNVALQVQVLLRAMKVHDAWANSVK